MIATASSIVRVLRVITPARAGTPDVDPVRELEDVAHVVADEDDSLAAGAQTRLLICSVDCREVLVLFGSLDEDAARERELAGALVGRRIANLGDRATSLFSIP